MFWLLFILFAGGTPVIADIFRYKYPTIELFGHSFQTMHTIFPIIVAAELVLMLILARRKKIQSDS
jgi:hypothetical protein